MSKPERPPADAGCSRRSLLAGAGAAGAAGVAAGVAALWPRPAKADGLGASIDEKFHRPYRTAAIRTAQTLSYRQANSGSYGRRVTDLAAYYKTPWMMTVAGRHHRAYRGLDYLVRQFRQPNGDFRTSAEVKSEDELLGELRPYANAWIVTGAQRSCRFDVAQPAWKHLVRYLHREGGAAVDAPVNAGGDVTDGFLTAHAGLAALLLGKLTRARRAGDYLLRLFEMQPDLGTGLYLRVDGGGTLVTDFAASREKYHLVRTKEPRQLYFLVGGIVGFLGKLYEATGAVKYLDAARAYLDFGLSCHESLLSFHFSHQLAWGAAVVSRLTGDETAEHVALEIVHYLAEIQEEDGTWFPDEPPYVALDRTVENAVWMLEVSAELVDAGVFRSRRLRPAR